MRHYVELDSLKLINGFSFPEQIAGNLRETKRGDTPSFDFIFGRAFSAPVEIDADAAITDFRFGAKPVNDLYEDYVISNWNGATFAHTKTGGARFSDAATTISSAALTSATAGFMASDAGRSIAGAGIPDGAKIAAVNSATSITLSAAATATAANVTITIIGRTPMYSVKPSLSTLQLNDLFWTNFKGTAADEAARYALSGLSNGSVVRQEDDNSYWVVIDVQNVDSSAGWSNDVTDAAREEYVDLFAELTWTIGSEITSTMTWTLRVWDDVNKGNEAAPQSAGPGGPIYTDTITGTKYLLVVVNGLIGVQEV